MGALHRTSDAGHGPSRSNGSRSIAVGVITPITLRREVREDVR
jgi:hypothetical protein